MLHCSHIKYTLVADDGHFCLTDTTFGAVGKTIRVTIAMLVIVSIILLVTILSIVVYCKCKGRNFKVGRLEVVKLHVHNANTISVDEIQQNACYGINIGQSDRDREPNNHSTIEPGLTNNNMNEVPYWDPANYEEDIKQQLMRLQVENMLKDNIE